MTIPAARRSRLLLAVAATAVALVLCEVALRVASPGYELRTTQYEIAPIDGEPPTWVYRPGSRAVFSWDGDPLGVLPPGARAEARINAAGLRGPLPAPGAPSVVVLGDSFTFGEGVALEETFVARVAAGLAQSGAPHALVNAGVAGHGTVEEAARLEALLDRFRPRAVLLVHVPNDAVPWGESADRGADLLNVERTGFSRILGLLQARSRSAGLQAWYRSYYDGDRAEHWVRARDALAWMAATCRQRGAAFGVAAFPFLHGLDEYPFSSIADAVRAACADTATPFLDLTPTFAGRDESELWLHPADQHPNARAHAIAAEALTPFVRSLVR